MGHREHPVAIVAGGVVVAVQELGAGGAVDVDGGRREAAEALVERADDALYAAVRLIEAQTLLGKSVTQMRGEMAPMINTPDEFARYIASETARYAKVIAFSGARID